MIQDINIGSSANDGTGDSARLAGQKINSNFGYLEGLINNSASVENNYNVPPDDDIAAMIADQANQTAGNFQYVADASADATVTSGGAYYEYLGTTVGDLTDYRKLSNLEATALVSGPREIKIGKFWVDTVGNTNSTIIEDGNMFRGLASSTRYVVGVVLDAATFDEDDVDNAAVKLFIDNN